MFLESAKEAGWIEVICGSMFSGKTEELIRSKSEGGDLQARNRCALFCR